MLDGAYELKRKELVDSDTKRPWYQSAMDNPSPMGDDARKILNEIRELERMDPTIYGNLPGEKIPDPDTREMGGSLFENRERIKRSAGYYLACEAPKGSHLHVHFNTLASPEALLLKARTEVPHTMYIKCDRLLANPDAFRRTEIIFKVLPVVSGSGECFKLGYDTSFSENPSCYMLWTDFRRKFPPHICPADPTTGLDSAECWVRDKIIVMDSEERKTHNGAWACFNQVTRGFKGLMNYESVYRWYISYAIERVRGDRTMYVELRQMMLDKWIPSNNGTRRLDLHDQMAIIREEVQKNKNLLASAGKLATFPFGSKVIYCTPRSILRDQMIIELNDCFNLKIAYPDLICGFDLVGAEDRPYNIRFYADLLEGFQKRCKNEKISIPFMFHAGETLLDTGGSANPENSNLYDAYLLGSMRVGHGVTLAKHPRLMKRYKKRNICLEVCLGSNEILGLYGNVRQHPLFILLANDMRCVLSADNPCLFESSLAYEFYLAMVGDPRMNIYRWKQFAEWSIEYSCLSKEEIAEGLKIYQKDWEVFCGYVVREFGPLLEGEASAEEKMKKLRAKMKAIHENGR